MLIPATNKVTKFSTSFFSFEDEKLLRLFSWTYDANKAMEMAFCTGYFNDIDTKMYDNVITFNYASR